MLNLQGANLSKTNLSEALLDGTSIEFANLQGAVLRVQSYGGHH
ncbi:MAG: pentapeptide repeat-containing protein [Anaerolineales bacterium]|nr:pentapeptide repeat-containing protein [Anaerolineales bacterium]